MLQLATAPRVLCLLCAAVLALAGSARAAPGWYCEPLQAFYPTVRSCPAPWRMANQTPTPQQMPATSSAPQAAPTAFAPKPPADPGGEPIFAAPASLARGDALDEWCKGTTTALNLAVCGDDELRALAIERLRAFSDANSRLTTDQRKALAGDQNGWAMSYPQSCGLSSGAPPPLPLAQSLKDCLTRAGRTRLAYLRSYGLPTAKADSATPTPASGPAETAAPAPTQPPPGTQSPAASAPPAISQSPPAPPLPASPASDASPTATPTPLLRIPPAEPQGHASSKPPSANPALAGTPPSSSTIPGVAKIVAMLIALAVVGIWLLSGLQRVRDLRLRKHPADPRSAKSAPDSA